MATQSGAQLMVGPPVTMCSFFPLQVILGGVVVVGIVIGVGLYFWYRK